jgi:serine/threonine-protein kinase
VIAQDPAGNSFVPPHSTVTLTVSNGPTTTGIPDVGGSDAQTAKGILKDSGFKVESQKQDTDNPSLDGIVISQDPPSGTEAEPGTVVTIVVGHYKKPAPPPPPPPTTTTTETVPTTTTTTTTTTAGAPPP